MKIPPPVYRWWLRVTDRPNALQLHQMDCYEARCQPWTDKERDEVDRFRRRRAVTAPTPSPPAGLPPATASENGMNRPTYADGPAGGDDGRGRT